MKDNIRQLLRRASREDRYVWIDAARFAGVPIALGSKNRWPAQLWFDYLMLRTAGPDYRAALMSGAASYIDPQVVKVMELWKELVDAGDFTPNANADDWTDAADKVARGVINSLRGFDILYIMLGLVFLNGQYSVAWGLQGALSLVASLPTLVVFLFFQRYFIKGMTMGAVKG